MGGDLTCTLFSMWLLVLLLQAAFIPQVASLTYRCQDDQVLIVQSFGNDTIRMHCQQLDLCGYQKLRCDYDELQPQCGGQMNFVAHVNQAAVTSPVEHTCCNLFNPRPPHSVPTHVGNDCFIYELPDGSSQSRPQTEAVADDTPFTVLKSAADIPEQIDGISGYRLRLFLLKNKAPPTLLVKGIERRLDGYRVTICRPRCTSYESIGQNERDDAGEWKAISWSSWTSSTWSSWARSLWGNSGEQTRTRTTLTERTPNPGTKEDSGHVNVKVESNGNNNNRSAREGENGRGNINITIHTGQERHGGSPSATADNHQVIHINNHEGSKSENDDDEDGSKRKANGKEYSPGEHGLSGEDYKSGRSEKNNGDGGDSDLRSNGESGKRSSGNKQNREKQTKGQNNEGDPSIENAERKGSGNFNIGKNANGEEGEDSGDKIITIPDGNDDSKRINKNNEIGGVRKESGRGNGKEDLSEKENSGSTSKGKDEGIRNNDNSKEIDTSERGEMNKNKTYGIDYKDKKNKENELNENDGGFNRNIHSNISIKGPQEMDEDKSNVKEYGKKKSSGQGTSGTTATVEEKHVDTNPNGEERGLNNMNSKSKKDGMETKQQLQGNKKSGEVIGTNKPSIGSNGNEENGSRDLSKSKVGTDGPTDNRENNIGKGTDKGANNFSGKRENKTNDEDGAKRNDGPNMEGSGPSISVKPDDIINQSKSDGLEGVDASSKNNNKSGGNGTSNSLKIEGEETIENDGSNEKERIKNGYGKNNSTNDDQEKTKEDELSKRNGESATSVLSEKTSQHRQPLNIGDAGEIKTSTEDAGETTTARTISKNNTTSSDGKKSDVSAVPSSNPTDEVEQTIMSSSESPTSTSAVARAARIQQSQSTNSATADNVAMETPPAAADAGPDASQLMASLKKMNCFAADTVVTTVTGIKRMDQLSVGDYVLVPAAGNVLKYERVEMFYHREPETRAQFIVLLTERGKRLALTPLHLLPFGNCNEMSSALNSAESVDFALRGSQFANKAKIGDCLLSVDSSGQVVADRIIKIGRQLSTGIYSPMTVEGAVVADGVLASCFSQLESHSVQKVVYDFLVYFNNLFGLTPGREEYRQGVPSFINHVHDLSQFFLPFAKY